MLSRTEQRRVRALRHRKDREETGRFLAEGVRLVEDLLAADSVLDLALIAPSLEDTPRGVALARALSQRVRTVAVSEEQLANIATTETPQGVAVVAAIPHYALDDVAIPARVLAVVLDGVQDPGNFGTIVRTADAFGATCVIALPGTVDAWNPKSVRAAMGSSLRLPILNATVDALQQWLKATGCRMVGADAAGESIESFEIASRTALVLGNEGAGLSDAVRTLLDGTVAVPIRGHGESLNVGVAAGILLYLLSRGH